MLIANIPWAVVSSKRLLIRWAGVQASTARLPLLGALSKAFNPVLPRMHLNYIYQWAYKLHPGVRGLLNRQATICLRYFYAGMIIVVVPDACVDCNGTKHQDKFLTTVNAYGKSNYSDSEPD